MTSMNTMGMYTDEYLPRLIDAPDRIRCGRLWLIEFDHRCNQNLHKVRFTDLRLSNSIIRHGEKVASSSHESNRRQSYNCIDGATQGQGPQTSVDSQERTRKDDVGRSFVSVHTFLQLVIFVVRLVLLPLRMPPHHYVSFCSNLVPQPQMGCLIQRSLLLETIHRTQDPPTFERLARVAHRRILPANINDLKL